MADNVGVRPSTTTGSVSVATDEISDVHYPIYKTAYGKDGEVILVDVTNGLPISMATDAKVQQEEIILGFGRLEKQLKIMNIHLATMSDMVIEKKDID